MRFWCWLLLAGGVIGHIGVELEWGSFFTTENVSNDADYISYTLMWVAGFIGLCITERDR